MEIKRASNAQSKVDIGGSLGGVVGASKSVERSLQVQQAVANQVTSISVDSLNKSLQAKGEEDALIDAAKDSKAKDDLITQAQSDYDIAEQELAANAGDANATLESFDAAFENTERARTNLADAKTAIVQKNLKMGGPKWNKYASSYTQKAQAIGLNKVLIDLDQQSTAYALQFKEGPIAYADAMRTYSDKVKESLPEVMHEAYNQKVLISANGNTNKINANVTKIQDQELAATTVEKMDLTRVNLLDSAQSNDLPGYTQAKQDYKRQLDTLVANRSITQSVADEQYRAATTEATQMQIMSEFDKLLAIDPNAAYKYADEFGSKTSSQMMGMSQRQLDATKKIPKDNRTNPYDLEYDAKEQTAMHTKMLATLKKYDTQLKASNKETKTDNNKKSKQMIESFKSGTDIGGYETYKASLRPGVNIGVAEYEDLMFYKDQQPSIQAFNTLEILDQQEYLNNLDNIKAGDPQLPELKKTLQETLDSNRKLIADDPGLYSLQMSNQELPTFNPSAPREYLDGIKGMMNYNYLQNGAPKKPLTNDQANQVEAYFGDPTVGRKDKLSFINNIGNDDVANAFFEQLGEGGSQMEVLYNVTQGKTAKSVNVADTIMLGQEGLDLKPPLYSYNKNDVDAYYRDNLNSRGINQDANYQGALKQSVIAYAVAANPDKMIDEAAIKEALDAVYGKTSSMGSWYASDLNDDMVIYDKSAKQVQTYMDNVTPDQIKQTMPDVDFYSKGGTNLTPETLASDISLGKVKLVGTGIAGEYTLYRNGQPIHANEPTDLKTKSGDQYVRTPLYKLRLWSN